jgi:hypothetical protein
MAACLRANQYQFESQHIDRYVKRSVKSPPINTTIKHVGNEVRCTAQCHLMIVHRPADSTCLHDAPATLAYCYANNAKHGTTRTPWYDPSELSKVLVGFRSVSCMYMSK